MRGWGAVPEYIPDVQWRQPPDRHARFLGQVPQGPLFECCTDVPCAGILLLGEGPSIHGERTPRFAFQIPEERNLLSHSRLLISGMASILEKPFHVELIPAYQNLPVSKDPLGEIRIVRLMKTPA